MIGSGSDDPVRTMPNESTFTMVSICCLDLGSLFEFGKCQQSRYPFFFCTSRQVYVTSSKDTGDDRRSRNQHTYFWYTPYLAANWQIAPSLTETFHQFHKIYHTQRKLEYVGIVYYFPQGWINLVPTLG